MRVRGNPRGKLHLDSGIGMFEEWSVVSSVTELADDTDVVRCEYDCRHSEYGTYVSCRDDVSACCA